jgi:hypothetical protein
LIAITERRRIERHLRPTVVLARARSQSRAAFVRGYSGTLMLLVRGDETQSDVFVGLDESTAEVPPLAPTGDRLAFSTSLDLEVIGGAVPVFGGPFDHLELRRRLLASPHFVLPIKKRELGAKPFSGKVSVGRARNNDIVLRHATVSKFHAWFELDDGRVFVGDARSKNRTWLGAEPLRPGERTIVPPGIELRFGRVAALIVSAEALWQAAIDEES